MIGTRLCKYEQRSNIIKNVINFLFELDFMFSSVHFWVVCFKQSSHSIQTQKNVLLVVVHVLITDQCGQDEIQVTVIDSCTCLVAVMSQCSVKRIICKSMTGILTNSEDPDQTPQNAASDQGLHCLLKLQED